MNYEEMSNLQINLLVANAVGVDAVENSGVVFGAVKHEGSNVVSVVGVVDYCNNPSDAWPIIVEYQISIAKYKGSEEWDAHGGGVCVDYDHCIISNSDCSYSNKNPLRASMIVFLMMEDAKNAD